MMRAAAISLLLAAGAWAQTGTSPKSKAAEYPQHAPLDDGALGVEYMVHSFTAQGQMFLVPGYLVVEVALYPQAEKTIAVNAGRFTLRVNGKKSALLPQAPGMVAASLKYADWEQRPRFEGSAGAGNAGVILGRPQSTERFPGDPRPGQERLPQPPQAPDSPDRSGAEKREPLKPDEQVVVTALPEGLARTPVSGYLYFAYKGKAGGIKSLELLYEDVVVKLI